MSGKWLLSVRAEDCRIYEDGKCGCVAVFPTDREADARACVEAHNAAGWRDIASAPKDKTIWLAYGFLRDPNTVLVNDGMWSDAGACWFTFRNHQLGSEYQVFAWHLYTRPNAPEMPK